MELKIKAVTLGKVLTTAHEVKTESGLILSGDLKKDAKKRMLKNVQEVVAVGTTVKAENGLPIVVGDKVLLNVENPRMGMPLAFNKTTGELAKETDKEADCEVFMLMEAREILMVLD